MERTQHVPTPEQLAGVIRGLDNACKYCNSTSAFDSARNIREAAAAIGLLRASNEKLLAALVLMYDKWENGAPCYEDPEDYTGPLGNAFKLTDDEETRVLEALESAGIKTALTFTRAADRALVAKATP
jgi:hypothetical protein